MFLFNSLHQGNLALKSLKVSKSRKVSSSLCSHWARSVFALAVMFCLSTAFLFTGCNTDDDTAGNLNGTWDYINPTYNYYVAINTSAKTIVYQNSYEGTIENSPDYTATDGVLIIKFTKYADWGDTPSTSHTNVGKYGAMYWTEQTVTSVKLADAYDSSFNHVIFNTLPEAQEAFTPAADKVGNYVSSWSGIAPLTKR